MLKLGLQWKEDNGLVLSHVNIFKMPMAGRQPSTSDACEEAQSWGEGRETGNCRLGLRIE